LPPVIQNVKSNWQGGIPALPVFHPLKSRGGPQQQQYGRVYLTKFQFQLAGLNFHSAAYEWLAISGAKAQYKGSGTINGAGNYGFLLTATDGQVNGDGGVDKFRIKIWYKNNGDAIVYDNAPGSDDIDASGQTAISGGSIVIHK
jgi:hypothetical protein